MRVEFAQVLNVLKSKKGKAAADAKATTTTAREPVFDPPLDPNIVLRGNLRYVFDNMHARACTAIYSSEVGDSVKNGGARSVTVNGEGSVELKHRTKPSINFSIWYRWNGTRLEIYGLGRHIGTDNKNYRVEWHTGQSGDVKLD